MITTKRKPRYYGAFRKLVRDVKVYCSDDSYPFYERLLKAYDTHGSKLDELIKYLLSVQTAFVQNFPDTNKFREMVLLETFPNCQRLIRRVEIKLNKIVYDKFTEYSTKLSKYIRSVTKDSPATAFFRHLINTDVQDNFLGSRCVAFFYYRSGKFLSQYNLSSCTEHDIAVINEKLEKEIADVFPKYDDSLQNYESRLFTDPSVSSFDADSPLKYFLDFAHLDVLQWLFLAKFLSKIESNKKHSMFPMSLSNVLVNLSDRLRRRICTDFRNLGCLVLGFKENCERKYDL